MIVLTVMNEGSLLRSSNAFDLYLQKLSDQLQLLQIRWMGWSTIVQFQSVLLYIMNRGETKLTKNLDWFVDLESCFK